MSKPEVKVRIKHEYRQVPYEVEFALSNTSQLDLVGNVVDEIIKFIDKMLENEKHAT